MSTRSDFGYTPAKTTATFFAATEENLGYLAM
jgi:hypothetical protein